MTAPGRHDPAHEPPPRDATWLAERTTLSALLHNPQRITALRGWLRPHDFAEPLHQIVYATVDRLQAAGRLQPGHSTADTLRAVYHAAHAHAPDAQLPSYRALLELHTTGAIAAADGHVRYGRMVLETSVRRQLHHWAIHLQPPTAHELLTNLAGLTAQVQQSQGHPVVHLPTAASPTRPEHGDAAATALPHSLVHRAEHQLIHAALTAPPSTQSALLRRFEPGDFTASSRHANTWRAMRTVAEQGEPVDAITVAWELETGPEAGNAGLGAEQLAAMTTPHAGDATSVVDRAADTVRRAAAQQHLHDASRQLAGVANNRQQHLGAVLSGAQDLARTLDAHQRRLDSPSTGRSPTAIRQALDGEHTPTSTVNTISRAGRR